MRYLAQMMCLLLIILLAYGCVGTEPRPIDVVTEAPLPPQAIETIDTQIPIVSPITNTSGTADLEGAEALEFADEYPDVEHSIKQLGIITEITADTITFDEATWLNKEDLTEDFAGDYSVQLTGKNCTVAIDTESQFWVLWDSHWDQPARISVEDFVEYFNRSLELVCHFYSSEGRLIMLCEQYCA